MTSIPWNLVCALLAFIALMVTLRSIYNHHRVQSRRWVREMCAPHHTATRTAAREEWSVGAGRVRTS